jgi:hypothetical protein
MADRDVSRAATRKGVTAVACPFAFGAWIAGRSAVAGTGWRMGVTGASGDVWAEGFAAVATAGGWVWAAAAALASLRFLTFSNLVTH